MSAEDGGSGGGSGNGNGGIFGRWNTRLRNVRDVNVAGAISAVMQAQNAGTAPSSSSSSSSSVAIHTPSSNVASVAPTSSPTQVQAQFVRLPLSSARKLRLYDRAELAEIVRYELCTKRIRMIVSSVMTYIFIHNGKLHLILWRHLS